MTKEIKTVREAAVEWVRGFNAFPRTMIHQLVLDDPDSWEDLTELHKGLHVNTLVYGEGEIVDVVFEGKAVTYMVELDEPDDKGNTVVECRAEDIEIDEYGLLPMWGTMWQFDDVCDEYWMEEKNGIAVMSSCGFKIFHHEEWGYFFGIDGAGYDFYENHWIPAYLKRGLQWHDEVKQKHAEV